MKNGSVSASAVLGITIGLGIMIAGFFMGNALYKVRAAERYVTVKGLAERDVDADLAIWPVTFRETDNDLSKLQRKVDANRKNIKEFLVKVGLTAGAAVMGRSLERYGARRRAFHLIQSAVCLYPLLLLGALILFSRAGVTGVNAQTLALQAQAAFPVLAFLAGFIGGLQFPLANALWLEETPSAARAAGYIYGVDLFGSCLGALLTSAMLVPVLGISYACLTASLLNAGSLLLLLLKRTQ